jgi:hypothetical protein
MERGYVCAHLLTYRALIHIELVERGQGDLLDGATVYGVAGKAA